MDGGLLGLVSDYVSNYGYLAVFALVFLQELGVPNPVPNELVLIFAGALTSIGGLSFWLTFLTAVSADIIGTTILFSAFYFFEHYIMEKISKWLPLNKKLEKIKATILKRGRWGIFLGRLMPYLRGYVSAAAGVLNLPYRVFLPMVIISAVLWSGGYVVLGHFLGTQWETVAEVVEQYKWSFVAVVVSILALWFYWRSRQRRKNVVKLENEKSDIGGNNNFPKV
ncbi:MAG: hypothetical protein UY12_C0014G0004 [Parcubacteria group bacterium GW2011_GWA2_47_8b]|uniref:VTT domain-containing protein n=1 Tax=Candidatus Harrisonbacteria bacterium RIFOXYA1_FULL_48_8 TaxID=1798411 RepID=A0A1G1ZV93_9BACT|nr:MAG: hypothetical protein UY12_C0014G0004 [Parcubacteria group bacterium GW2011_GWA2_47_8b]KKU93782.1 MAG: hypothetical protein UY24_C0018G0008 [Parcubacteria group bacterium GW2011_GWA1_48_11b]OGY68399.1 MAG: hypothetical protein A2214_00510 [Candidatus Harrisonbacteria bacterium RIFOXYA1_FULL_48_8]